MVAISRCAHPCAQLSCVLSTTSESGFHYSSPWILGAPHNGLAMLITRQKHCAIRSHVPARPIGTGLTISITGSKDLMLFEVDEAAARICEEADQDANIIVGASLDESLEGIVRVSLVATA